MDEVITLISEFWRTRYRPFGSREQVEAWQQQHLTQHLDWVCCHSPYYRSLQGAALSDFPIMNKQTMMENLSELNTKGLDAEQLMQQALDAEQSRNFAASKVGDVTVGLSSGTSGMRGLFLADKQETQLWAGNILARLLPNLWQKHRIALALRANSPLYKSVAKGPVTFFYADLTKPYQEWIKELDEFQPTLLVGSAQALQLCAQFSGQFGQPAIQPQRIISGAEVLTESDRHFISQRFDSELHEVYQCTEGFLACTDQHGQMRWNQDVVYIEKHWLNTERTHYSPIITDFRRKTQPIIRYQLDDIIENKQDNGVFEPLGAIAGRCGDRLTLNANHVPVTVLPDLIYRAITLSAKGRVDYRITQTGSQAIQIEADVHHHRVIHQALIKLFDQLRLDPVRFSYRPAPIWTPMNKQRRVVNICGS
ncbi:F390 synthetase-related protein [Vibrio alginolyticus]|uniref:F390 synthetase-related protein n=1 Tax=Vibrio TaxID=662 RepID=UPI003F6E2FA7